MKFLKFMFLLMFFSTPQSVLVTYGCVKAGLWYLAPVVMILIFCPYFLMGRMYQMAFGSNKLNNKESQDAKDT